MEQIPERRRIDSIAQRDFLALPNRWRPFFRRWNLKLFLASVQSYHECMKTMTATQARQNLGTLLSRVLQGEDTGIVHSSSGKIIALCPVEVYSEDYALVEYGLADNEMKRAEKTILSAIRKERKSGKLKRWRP
jgi:hypothetical protein